jgi:hypothetical protein
LCANYNISIDKVGKSKHNKTFLRYRNQKKDNMFRPFYYKAIISSDLVSPDDGLIIKGPKHVVFLLIPISTIYNQ